MTDLTKVADALFASVKGYVARSLEPIAARVQALEKREPERGERGEPGPAGEAGHDGAPGAPGASAYELAVAAGFVGDEVEWLLSLQGERGADGKSVDQDAVQQAIGVEVERAVAALPAPAAGAPGASAYEVAVRAGFAGDEASWLQSLKGERGADGASIDREAMQQAIGVEVERAVALLPAPAAGPPGASAYELALAAGFTGDAAAWLESLKGERGTDGASVDREAVQQAIGAEVQRAVAALPAPAPGEKGASAYELAVAAGFVGDEAAWLLSLKGERGADAAVDLDAIHQAIGTEVQRAVEALPKAQDGKDADPAAVAELVTSAVDKAMAELPKLVREHLAEAQRAVQRIDRSFSERVSKALGREVEVVAEELSHG